MYGNISERVQLVLDRCFVCFVLLKQKCIIFLTVSRWRPAISELYSPRVFNDTEKLLKRPVKKKKKNHMVNLLFFNIFIPSYVSDCISTNRAARNRVYYPLVGILSSRPRVEYNFSFFFWKHKIAMHKYFSKDCYTRDVTRIC